jgi:selenocysteine lyase/cysteine desulfurase
VIIFADNHPSNNAAWKTKSERWGFTVRELAVPNPHPGADYHVDAVTKAITSRTRLVAITHVTTTNGDLFPAKEICRVARERGVLCHLDGAQSFGLVDVDLGDIKPDFYGGSGHKWPCGPKPPRVAARFQHAREIDRTVAAIRRYMAGGLGTGA